LCFDQFGERNRVCLHCLLSQSIEQFAARSRRSAVESKCEFVEVVIQVGVRNRALMGAEQPSFEQRDRAMDARKQVFSGILMALNLAIMNVSLHSEVGGKAVGSNRAPRHNGLSDESMESGSGQIRIQRMRMRPMPFPSSSAATAIRALSSAPLPSVPGSSPPQ